MLDREAQKLIVDGKLRVWIDIDVNGSRDAYQRAVDFVGAMKSRANIHMRRTRTRARTRTLFARAGAKNLAYSLSSNWLPELGGSEVVPCHLA